MGKWKGDVHIDVVLGMTQNTSFNGAEHAPVRVLHRAPLFRRLSNDCAG